MTDIVERLRKRAEEEYEMLDNIHEPLLEAADTIEALQAEIKENIAFIRKQADEIARLLEALKRYVDEADSLRKHWPITHD